MKNGRGMAALCVVIGSVVSSACTEWGLPKKNTPAEETMNHEWRYAVYEKMPEAAKLYQIAGHSWQITGASEVVPGSMLEAVTTIDGKQVFALKSDKAPYDQLYTPGDNGRYTVVSAIN